MQSYFVHLLSKHPNHEEDFFKFWVLFRKSELYITYLHGFKINQIGLHVSIFFVWPFSTYILKKEYPNLITVTYFTIPNIGSEDEKSPKCELIVRPKLTPILCCPFQTSDRAGCFGCRKREAGPDSGPSGTGVPPAAKLPTGFQNSNGGPHHPQQQQHLGPAVHHHSLPHHHGGFNGYGGFYGGWNLPHHPVSPASQPPPLAPPVQLGLASANKWINSS